MSNNYFSHDSNARNSDRVIPLRAKLQAEGYAIYFMILERLREEPDYTSVKDYNMLAFDFRVDAAKVKAVVEDFGLFSFTDNGKRFYSESFLRRMQVKDIKSEKARQSANCRWEKCERNANAQKNDANKEKKSKVKKENNTSNEVLQKKAENPPSPPSGDSVNNPPQSDAQEAPPPTPSPARSTPQPPSNFGLLPVREAAEAAMNEPIWVENIRMKHKLSMGGLRQNIEEFIPHCCSRGKEKDSLMGFKQHFDSWMDKKRQFGENGQNGAQKGRYEKLTQTRNEALKMLGIDDD